MLKALSFTEQIEATPPDLLTTIHIDTVRRFRVAEFKHYKLIETSYVDVNFHEIIETLTTFSGKYAILRHREIRGVNPMYAHPRASRFPLGQVVRLTK